MKPALRLTLLSLVLLFCAVAVAEGPDRPSSALPPAERALAGWDASIGLWYPDPALRSAYLARDPEHPLIQEAKEAFTKDPALLDAVLPLLADYHRQPSQTDLPPQLRQLQTMFYILCSGMKQSLLHADRFAEQRRQRADEYRSWLERDTASALPPEERFATTRRLRAEEEGRPADERRLRVAFRMLGLTPADDVAMDFLLSGLSYRSAAEGGPLLLTLREVLVSEGAGDDPESVLYRSALRNLEMYEGHFQTALEMTRELLRGRRPEELDGDRFLLAFLERVAGRKEPLRAWLARCTAKEGPGKAAARPPGAGCRDQIFRLARRIALRRGATTLPVFADLLVESSRPEPSNWPMRFETICAILDFAPDRAWQEAEALLRPPAIPPDLWTRLTEVPADEPGRSAHGSDEGSPCDVTRVLASRFRIALDSSDPLRARRALERYVQGVLAIRAGTGGAESLFDVKGLSRQDRRALRTFLEDAGSRATGSTSRQVRVARDFLRMTAELELRLGHGAEARRIAGYLLNQPRGSGTGPDPFTMLQATFRAAEAKGAPQPEIVPQEAPWEAERISSRPRSLGQRGP